MYISIDIDYGRGILLLNNETSHDSTPNMGHVKSYNYELKYEFKYDNYDKLIYGTQNIIESIKNNTDSKEGGLVLESYYTTNKIKICIKEKTIYFIIYESITLDICNIGIPITNNITDSLINEFSTFLYKLNIIKNNLEIINKLNAI